MASTGTRSALVAGTALTLGSAGALLPRMRREFDQLGALGSPTVAWMYGTYAAHALATAAALAHGPASRRRTARRPTGVPGRLLTGGAYGLAAAGSGVVVAGMSRFAGPGQVSGTDDGQLAESGVYRWTRNPQYVGYLVLLTGLALARRSLPAAALTAGAAGTFAWWVRVEERHLELAYGEPYRRYAERVPRWLSTRRS